MKAYEIKDNGMMKFTIYLPKEKVEPMGKWLSGREEVLHIIEAAGLIMVDLTPLCEDEDVKKFFNDLEKELKEIS